MPNPHGVFIWYELLTSDPQAAASFYGAVLGWKAKVPEIPGVPETGYRLFSTGETEVAGLMALPPGAAEQGMGPGWLGYVGVEDVDAAAAAILAAGGAQHMPPTDIPGVGRFAFLADPQGVPFYVMRGASPQASTAFDRTRPGHCHWNELTAPDPVAALAFYGKQFGWERQGAMPMGSLGEYQFIALQGKVLGAIMPKLPDSPRAAWNFYFGVADIDAAAKAVTGAGGTIHHGPEEVPGELFIIVGSDPQGAAFGLVGPRRA
ncbi:VOC family protein [Siccirubricoccus sp. KC 17139]|uniref:VOC family protein n=1 Tax=Siccirubricoccus soli TaxID=2899147 RepID=A0ABT1D0G2_9PROT|nr:VOC family protein [Siccirubricoccus soli]MCO6415398.1 VOC family protein [Siccirubricoccus soli]MCP2681530.1 VOC family protein [Siccirubricoccus soli]